MGAIRILLVWLLLAWSASAASYYVDASRPNDDGNGLTAETAWKTIAKVNTIAFSPGDTIHFKRGETWTEKLIPLSSGSSGNPITFTAYGSGALPIIKADLASARDEAITLVTGRSYITISYLHCKGGDTYVDTADGLIESDSITNLIKFCTLDAESRTDNCIGGKFTAEDCLILNADDDGVTTHAGGSYIVRRCTFNGNTSAVNNSSSQGNPCTTVIEDCIFEENGNGTSSTGDINVLSYGTHTISRCDFRGRADGAAHGFITTGTALGGEVTTVNYCRFDNSRAVSLSNGSISASSGAILNLNNCTIVHSVATSGTPDRGSVTGNTGILNATNCILVNIWRLKATAPGEVNLSNCLTYNVGGIDNAAEHVYTSNTSARTADPLFTDAPNRLFTLQAGSPAKDVGTNLGLTTDLAGNAVGASPDLGAYEFTVLPSATIGGLTIGNLTIP